MKYAVPAGTDAVCSRGGNNVYKHKSQENGNHQRLYRSRRRIIGGVCQGLADYFNVDVVLVRIIALFALFCFSAGFWVYLVLWIAVPLEPASANGGDNYGRS